MRAGKLRHLLTLQSFSRTSDGGGGANITWSNVAQLYGSVEPLTGSELYGAQRQNPKISHAIRIRYRDEVSPSMRILLESRIFNIQQVRNTEERDRELTLICEEQVGVTP